MADENIPTPPQVPQFEIPDFAKMEEEKKKKKKGGAALLGGAPGGSVAEGGGLFSRLAALFPGLAASGSGPMLAMMGLTGVIAIGAALSMNSGPARVHHAKKVAVGDVDVKDNSAQQQDSSLGMVAGANSGSGMFDEAAKPEAKKEETPAPAADASASQPAPADTKAAEVAPTATNASPADPFAGHRMASKFGQMSGGFGSGGGGMGKFGPSGIGKDGVGGNFKSMNLGNANKGKLSGMGNPVTASGRAVSSLHRGGSSALNALTRAAGMSRMATTQSGGAASYTAQQAFEPGAGMTGGGDTEGAQGGGDAPTTPGLLGSGGGGGGGGANGGGTPNIPTGTTVSNALDIEMVVAEITFGTCCGLICLAGALALAGNTPYTAYLKGVAGSILAVVSGLVAAFMVSVGIQLLMSGKTLLGTMYCSMGALLAVPVITAMVGNPGAGAIYANLVCAGLGVLGDAIMGIYQGASGHMD